MAAGGTWHSSILAIDSKLRACDLVSLKVQDVYVGSLARERTTVVQKKNGRPVQFEISLQTRAALEALIGSNDICSSDYMFPSRFETKDHLSIRQYARLVYKWVEDAGLDTVVYGTHSMRRTKASQIYKNRQSSRRATPARPHQAGKHRSRSWN